jgi:putative ABC transport system permease protein
LLLRDLIREAGLSVISHPGQSLFTALGIVLGGTAFVGALGISSTLSHQVSESFDVRRATEVVVRVAQDAPGDQSSWRLSDDDWLTVKALRRLRELNGVVAAGRRTVSPESTVTKAPPASSPSTAQAGDHVKLRIVGLDPNALSVIEPRIVVGRTFDAFHNRRAEPVVLLPESAARSLGIGRTGVAVFLDGRAYTVIGIFDDVKRESSTLAGIVMPISTAQDLAGSSTAKRANTTDVEQAVLIDVTPGAAQLIGRQAPYALAPQAPDRLESLAAHDLGQLRRDVESDVTRMAMLLSLLALALGTVSIANAATAGVASRTAEIGLRRALGARPGHIFGQLLTETTLLGGLGGLLGAATGITAVVVVSFVNDWQPVLDLWVTLGACSGGILAGLVAGLGPGWRAIRIEPVAALQR